MARKNKRTGSGTSVNTLNDAHRASIGAKILYRPIGLVSSVLGGVVAGQVFKQVWKKASPEGHDDAPTALDTRYPLREVVIATILQGAIFALVKLVIHRGGARVFQLLTGEWPGK